MWKTGVLLLWAPTVILAARQVTTQGDSGLVCGTTKCLGYGVGECVSGQCFCDDSEFGKGLGNFVCLRKDEQYAVIFNDPVVRGFDQSWTKIPLVCKFLAAHISTTACRGEYPINVLLADGMCDFRFFAWGGRQKGKTFIRGIQVNIMLWVGNSTYYHTTRVQAKAVNGVYTYTEDGNTNTFGAPPFGDPVTTVVPGLGEISTGFDSEDNFARIFASPCGIEVGFRIGGIPSHRASTIELLCYFTHSRGVDEADSSLQQSPGVYIKVLQGCEPKYLSDKNVIFSPPPGHGTSLAEEAREVSNLVGFPVTPAMVAVYRAFTGQQMQDFPGAPVEVQMLADIVHECDVTTVYESLRFCLFVIDRPRFLNCYDKTSNLSVATGLLGECIFSICDSNPYMCRVVQNKVSQSKCSTRIRPTETSILDYDCDSLGQ